jgi:hypothetical protein
MDEPRGPVRGLAALLAVGGVALLGGVALHPMLPLTAEGDLAVIVAAGARWPAVHQVLLLATGCIIAGIWAPGLAAPREVRIVALAAAGVLALGEALNGVNIAYMLGGATTYARFYSMGHPEAGLPYQAGHLAVVMVGRLGAELVSLSAALWAWVGFRTRGEPRWIPGLAVAASLGGMLGVLLATPGHPLMLTSIGVMAVWQAAVGSRLLFGTLAPSIPPSSPPARSSGG